MTPSPDTPERHSGKYLVYRSRLLLGLTLGTANLGGAIIVFVFAAFLVPPSNVADSSQLIRFNALAAVIYVAIATPIGVLVGRRSHKRVENWLLEGREPTPLDAKRTLGVPRRLTIIQLTLWMIAAVGFTIANGIVNPLYIGRVAMTVLSGALTTASLTFLLTERIDRPVVARALEHNPDLRRHPAGVTSRTMLSWLMGTGVPLIGIIVAGIGTLITHQVSSTQLAIAMVALGGVGFVFGFVITLLGVRSIATPVRAVRRAMGSIEAGDLDVRVTVDSGTEVGILQSGFNQMAAGLGERERIRDLFGRHVGDEVARAAMETGIDLRGESRIASVLFVDIVSSTGLAATLSPRQVLALLNRFFAIVVDVVDDEGGWINKFIGDAAMAVFGAPEFTADHAGSALAVSRHLATRLKADIPELDFGIGVSTGLVVAGHIGDERRYEYTIIGDPVNVASRLTDAAKTRPARVLADWTAVQAAQPSELDKWNRCDDLTVRGREAVVAVATPRSL